MTEPSELAMKHARPIVEMLVGRQNVTAVNIIETAHKIDEAIQESRKDRIKHTVGKPNPILDDAEEAERIMISDMIHGARIG